MNIDGEGVQDVPDLSTIPQTYWKNDLSLWPIMNKSNIEKYLLEMTAIDGCPNGAYLSLEAVDFLISGWVDTVLICKTGKETVLLKAKVARSQSTTKEDHQAWVFCKQSSGEVLSGSCSCMAGLGRVCSHVAALLFKILEANKQGINQISCTDSPMTWNRSTRRHVLPEKVKNIKRKKNYADDNLKVISPSKKFAQYYDHDELKESVSVNPFSNLMNLDSTLWHSVINASDDCSAPRMEQKNVHSNHDDNYCVESACTNFCVSCEFCKDFYCKYVNITLEQRSTLCNETLMQASSDMWMDSRKIRITASTASKCPKRPETKPDKFLKSHIHGTFKGNVNTEHGIRCEPEAIKAFQEISSFKVIKAGTVVSEKDCWLSASPDGLVGNDSILEVKCPIKDVFELVSSGKYDVRKNEENQNFLHRSGKNGYFLQVQLTLYCTKRSICYLFVWGITSSVLVTVEYDEIFVRKELERLRTFYFKQMLPFLCNEKEQGKLMFGRSILKLLKLSNEPRIEY